MLRFTEGKPSPTISKIPMKYGAATGVANDENGNLLFYSTGCKIISKNFEVMENGDDIDSGADNIESCPDLGGALYLKNGTFVLPDSKDENIYNVFYLRIIRTSDTSNLIDRLYQARVDVSANNGLGRVLEKNKVILEDSLRNQISVTRHGNGRDWWIVFPRGVGREFWRILVGSEGTQVLDMITIPEPQPPFSVRFEWSDAPGTYYSPNEYYWEIESSATFSPDGTMFCTAVLGTGLELYDFDRCTGLLTFRRLIQVPRLRLPKSIGNEVTVLGLAFSPNNRYLYFNNGEALFQLDVCDACLATSEPIEIGIIDGFRDLFLPVTFFNMRNGPDGKIYMGSASTSRLLHVIHEPDKKGSACNFEQRGIAFPFWNSWIINNFPNFNLLDLRESPCDSLGIDNPFYVSDLAFDSFRIFPNPANEAIQVYIPDCIGGRIRVWDVQGRLIAETESFAGMEVYRLSTADWVSGMYFFEIIQEKTSIRKVVVTH